MTLPETETSAARLQHYWTTHCNRDGVPEDIGSLFRIRVALGEPDTSADGRKPDDTSIYYLDMQAFAQRESGTDTPDIFLKESPLGLTFAEASHALWAIYRELLPRMRLLASAHV